MVYLINHKKYKVCPRTFCAFLQIKIFIVIHIRFPLKFVYIFTRVSSFTQKKILLIASSIVLPQKLRFLIFCYYSGDYITFFDV